MSRTLRLGRKARNLHHYTASGVLCGEREYYIGRWGDEPYSAYAAERIRLHHRDGTRRSEPRYVRHEDLTSQKGRHKKAIARAWRTGDWDVVLEGLRKDAVWSYW